MKAVKKIAFPLLACLLLAIAFSQGGCFSVRYGFRDKTSIPDTINLVKVYNFENTASYVNTQLAPQLSDKVRQKIISQTRLKQTNGDNADWEISGTIKEYSFSTSGIANQREATNRLTVSVHVIWNKIKDGTTQEFDISRNFEFSSSITIEQAGSSLKDEMIRGLTDDIFNRIFTNW